MPKRLKQNETAEIRGALLRWFRRSARPLPWRGSKSAYPVWVSEVMLQQTQVATVIPYFNRFLRVFPTIQDLARAPLERVLQLWSGLGYYRRARQLHQAARIVCEEFGGDFPQQYHLARSLPGVGDYTARAVLSIAYSVPLYVLDGNVARVIARILALRANMHQSSFRQSVTRALECLLSKRRPGEFNQAVMELGQTVCTPRDPRCTLCPLKSNCRGYNLGSPQRYPAPRPRRAAELHYLATAIIRRGDRVGMIRGLDDGVLSDLWNFPSAFGVSPAKALARLKEKLAALSEGQVEIGPPFSEIKHGITFRAIRVRTYSARIVEEPARNSLRWFRVSTLPKEAVSQLARKIAGLVLQSAST
ncbi:MAG TPA: A/G-specific adenine glycosylase [Terriglobia bacterium]|nr:A/G-specific adenine glycosylase [Terriglobia bacterium]